MQVRNVVRSVVFAAACWTVGCAGSVQVSHSLPAAVPVPDSLRPLQAGEVTIHGVDANGLRRLVGRTLIEELSRINRSDSNGQVGRLAGEFHVTVRDQRGTRQVRRGRPRDSMEKVTLDTLVRTVDIRAEFPVLDPSGQTVVTLSVQREYDSRRDPRVRGQLGLGRSDDPQRVPETETILRELLVECTRRGVDLVRRPVVRAAVPLRDTFNGMGRKGLDAMRKGRHAKAARLFGDALAEHPRDAALLYNRAVACEAIGELDVALRGYRKVLAEEPDNKEARAGTERVTLVLTHRASAQPIRSTQAP